MSGDRELKNNLHQTDDDEPLKEDEEYQHVEEEIEVEEEEPDSANKNTGETQTSEFPDWVNGKNQQRRHKRRVKKRIQVRKKVKIKKKSNTKKYKKLGEKVLWTLIITGFIASMVVLIKELDIVDSRNKTKKKSMNKEWFNNHLTEKRISNQINIS